MNVRIFPVHAMECMCGQVRTWFILSSKSLGGMESEPMFTPREKSPLLEKFSSEEDQTHNAASSRTVRPTHYQQAIPAPVKSVQLTNSSMTTIQVTGHNSLFISNTHAHIENPCVLNRSKHVFHAFYSQPFLSTTQSQLEGKHETLSQSKTNLKFPIFTSAAATTKERKKTDTVNLN